MALTSLLPSFPSPSLPPLPFTFSPALKFGPGRRPEQPKFCVCLVISEFCSGKFLLFFSGVSIFRRHGIEGKDVLLGICVCCSVTRIWLLDVLKSKWILVCCSKIVSIQSLIPTLLGHKSSSTNFVVIFNIVESVITVQLSYSVVKVVGYFLLLYTSVVLTEV